MGELKPPPYLETIAAVRARLEVIRENAEECDHQTAHGNEDSLHRDVLRTIADGKNIDPASDLARAALETYSIKFSRWYA